MDKPTEDQLLKEALPEIAEAFRAFIRDACPSRLEHHIRWYGWQADTIDHTDSNITCSKELARTIKNQKLIEKFLSKPVIKSEKS